MYKIIKGEKDFTWWFFDDKDLIIDDNLLLVNSDNGQEFAKAVITGMVIKAVHDLTELDMKDKFESIEEVCEIFSNYYGKTITLDDRVKIIRFRVEEILV